jgi:hypothetical protein
LGSLIIDEGEFLYENGYLLSSVIQNLKDTFGEDWLNFLKFFLNKIFLLGHSSFISLSSKKRLKR